MVRNSKFLINKTTKRAQEHRNKNARVLSVAKEIEQIFGEEALPDKTDQYWLAKAKDLPEMESQLDSLKYELGIIQRKVSYLKDKIRKIKLRAGLPIR